MRGLTSAALLILVAACNTHQAAPQPTAPAVPQPPAADPASSGVRVTGQVVDFATNVGLSDTVVAFGDVTAVTNSLGWYTLNVPQAGRYEPTINGTLAGTARVTGSTYRGDLLVRPGSCISRYGTVADARTHQPVEGATVSLDARTTVTAADGWYSIDVACTPDGTRPSAGLIAARRAGYAEANQVVGRNISGVFRIDLELQPR